MNKIIIAIDGFSSTGKSTIAKQVAKELGYIYVDTGAMYRAVTYIAIQNDLCCATSFFDEKTKSFRCYETIDEEALLKVLKNSQLSFQYNEKLGFSEMFLDNQSIEKEIRGIEVANKVSMVAQLPQIRKYLVDLQRNMGKQKGIVMDGRDIGTIVFPNSELKIFMTASEQVRAQRRYDELIAKGEKVTFDEVLKNVQQRDFLDTTRSQSPLRKAHDAIELDNTHTTIEQMVQQIVALARQKLQQTI